MIKLNDQEQCNFNILVCLSFKEKINNFLYSCFVTCRQKLLSSYSISAVHNFFAEFGHSFGF